MSATLLWDNANSFLTLFDITTNEDHNASAMVTEHPVEDGVNITDHVRPNPDRIKIEGFVSASPIYNANLRDQLIVLDVATYTPPFLPTPGQIIGAAVSAISNLISPAGSQQIVAHVSAFDSAPNFLAEALTALKDLMNSATIVTVVTTSQIYENMIIDEIGENRTPDTGTGANFSVSFRQIRIVASATAQAPTPAILRASPAVSNGGQAAKVPAHDSAKAQSIVRKLLSDTFQTASQYAHSAGGPTTIF